MATATVTQSYRYAAASVITAAGVLALQTCGGVSRGAVGVSRAACADGSASLTTESMLVRAHPHFFSGFLAEAQPAAAGLLGLANVAATAYYRKAPPYSRDPVVTCDAERLRFESFSACGGVYARLDVLPDAMWTAKARENGTVFWWDVPPWSLISSFPVDRSRTTPSAP